jgi:hypothetical protein
MGVYDQGIPSKSYTAVLEVVKVRIIAASLISMGRLPSIVEENRLIGMGQSPNLICKYISINTSFNSIHSWFIPGSFVELAPGYQGGHGRMPHLNVMDALPPTNHIDWGRPFVGMHSFHEH